MEVDQIKMLSVFKTLEVFLSAVKSPDDKITAAIEHLDDVCLQTIIKNLKYYFQFLKKRRSEGLLLLTDIEIKNNIVSDLHKTYLF